MTRVYTITLTGVFDADSPQEACALFREWASLPYCVEIGAEITPEPTMEDWAR